MMQPGAKRNLSSFDEDLAMMTPGYIIEAMKTAKAAVQNALLAREHDALAEALNAIIEREKAAASREEAHKAQHDGGSWFC